MRNKILIKRGYLENNINSYYDFLSPYYAVKLLN